MAPTSKKGRGFSALPSQQVVRRMATIPVPKKLKSRFAHAVMHWSAHSGVEWTVTRVGAFRDCVMQSWGAGEIQAYPEWFSTTRQGNPKGIWRDLLRFALSGSENFRAVLMLLNIRTIWTRQELSSAIERDICKSVTAQPVYTGEPASPGCRLAGPRRIRYAIRKRIDCRPLRSMKYPVPLTMVLPGKPSHIQKIPEDLLDLQGTEWEGIPLVQHAVGLRRSHVWTPGYPRERVGRIHVTHEPGLKTRYFAAPNVVLQRALEPLKQGLLGVVKRLPWDCTHDQRKADRAIQTRLKGGHTVHSIDLSKATDNFPWAFQKNVLNALLEEIPGDERDLPTQSARLFISIVEEGGWECPKDTFTEVKWTRGQPLGLGPSFPLFTLSHGLLLYILNGMKWGESFYVLGDDVVIFSDLLAAKYRNVLREWEIPVSENKSFASNRLAQFAGVTYTHQGSFWIPKWYKMTAGNILDLQAWWYPGLTKGYRDEELILRVLALPQPYGYGRNPYGYPLDVRLSQDLVDALISRE